MKFHNRSSKTAFVSAYDQTDLLGFQGGVAAWSAQIAPGSSAVWKPAAKDARQYKARVTLNFGLPGIDDKHQYVERLGDSGQWIVIEDGAGKQFRLRSGLDATPTTPRRDPSNWMGEMERLLRNAMLNEVLILGTHDSGSFSADMTQMARTQDLDLVGQLDRGVRYFDMRITYSAAKGAPFLKNDTFYLCHNGVTARDLVLEDQLRAVRSWAATHPREIIIMTLQRLMTGVDPDFAVEFDDRAQSNLADLLRTCLDGVILEPKTLRFSDLWASSGNVIIIPGSQLKGPEPGLTPWDIDRIWAAQNYFATATMGWPWTAAYDVPRTKAEILKELAGLRGSPTHFTRLDAAVWGLNIRAAAALLNPELISWIRDWMQQDEYRKNLNIVCADFVEDFAFIEAFTQMNEAQLTSDTGGLVQPGPRRTSAATVEGTSAGAPTTPTGRTTVGVAFSISSEEGNRALVQAEPRVWIEVDPMGGTLYDFAETSRDDWSVMLHDESRDTRLQIDLHRRMIRCKQGSGDWFDLYQILDARTG